MREERKILRIGPHVGLVFTLVVLTVGGCDHQQVPKSVPPILPMEFVTNHLEEHYPVMKIKEQNPDLALSVEIMDSTCAIFRFYSMIPADDAATKEQARELDQTYRKDFISTSVESSGTPSGLLAEDWVSVSVVDSFTDPVDNLSAHYCFSKPVRNPFESGLGAVGVFVQVDVFAPHDLGSLVVGDDTYWVALSGSSVASSTIHVSSGMW